MNCDTATRDTLIRQAQTVAKSVINERCPLTAACIVSSLAAGDFTPASDVDMLLIAADDKGQSGIIRRLVGDRVFEWMVLPNDELGDADAILADAGLCHDVLDAMILLDTDGRLGQVQREVRAQYQEPKWIYQRVTSQLRRTAGAVEQMRRYLDNGDILPAQRAHVSVLKGFFALPRTVLNKRCTMARGLLFCRESAAELGWSEYLADVVTLFGVRSISREDVGALQNIAANIIAATEFTETEKAIRRRFLHSSQWLLENGGPAEAVWPLYFWSSATVEEAGGSQNSSLWDTWCKFASALGSGDEQSLRVSIEQAERLYESAVVLVEKYRL